MAKSKLNIQLKKELLLAQKKMTPKERLEAFYEHSRLMMLLFKAGENYRKRQSKLHKTKSLPKPVTK